MSQGISMPSGTSPGVLQVTVSKCPRCGQSHDVEARPFLTGTAAFSHWFICPNSGEPASLNVLAEEQGKPLDTECIKALEVAQQCGNYFISIWRIENGQIMAPFWKTENWPRGDFDKSLEMLAESIAPQKQDPNAIQPAAPLPRATPVPLMGQLPPQFVGPPSMPENVSVIDAHEVKKAEPSFDNAVDEKASEKNPDDVW